MGDNTDNCFEIFVQDGVQLKSAPASYMNYLNLIGTLYVTEYLNSNRRRCIEWKPVDITVESVPQEDQLDEWSVVKTQKRTRTVSESQPPDANSRPKFLKIQMSDIKSFRTSNKARQLTFYDGKSEAMCVFFFQNGNCDHLTSTLRVLLKTIPAKRDKHLFIIITDEDTEALRLDKSFAELNLFQDSHSWWKLVKDFHDRPVEMTFESFAKVTDFVYKSPDQREIDEAQKELLQRSLTEYASSHSQGDYEVIAKVPELPERKIYLRGSPLSEKQWYNLHNCEGRIEENEVKKLIFRGGVAPNIRCNVWKYLLDYYPWNSTEEERKVIKKQKSDEYYQMKIQWKTITKAQEDNFSDYRERKSLIEKDVNRTDRTLDLYAGDDNPYIEMLSDILMTYVMYNFDLGYVQGMSDLLSPILYLLRDEVDAFWCFAGFMNKVCNNFDIDQAGMKEQLQNLHTLLGFVEPELVKYLDEHESGNMFFCFRWLLVWFKRELNYEEVMRLWEVLWTGLPCKNFHLLVCVAILESEKGNLIGNNYGFTEILKHINDLNGHLNMPSMFIKAEGIYNQIKEADHLTDNIRTILGLPIPEIPVSDELSLSISPSENDDVYIQHFNTMENIMT